MFRLHFSSRFGYRHLLVIWLLLSILFTSAFTVSHDVPKISYAPGPFNKTAPANNAIKTGSVTFTWGISSNAASYEFCMDATNDNACSTWVSTGTLRTKTMSGLANGTRYYWQVRARNAAGVTPANGSPTAYWTFKVDTVPPRVLSIALADPNPSNAASVRFTVKFSEAVIGVDPSDFHLAVTGIAGAGITSVTGTGSSRSVTVGTGSGFGTIKLIVDDNDTIKDFAINPLGGAGIGNGAFTTGPKYTLDRNNTFISLASYDGWTLESAEGSSLGGSINQTGLIVAGDDALNKQYRSLLHFDTSGLPDNAIVVKALLKVRLASLVGTYPFTTHGQLLADIRKGFFGTLPGLQALDFQSPASKLAAGAIVPVAAIPGLYQMVLPNTSLAYINKLGPTQFRLRFFLDDNNDKGADYITFYAGDYASAAYRPVLVVRYIIP